MKLEASFFSYTFPLGFSFQSWKEVAIPPGSAVLQIALVYYLPSWLELQSVHQW